MHGQSLFFPSNFYEHLNIKLNVYSLFSGLSKIFTGCKSFAVSVLRRTKQIFNLERYLPVFYCVVLHNIMDKSQVWSETFNEGLMLIIDLIYIANSHISFAHCCRLKQGRSLKSWKEHFKFINILQVGRNPR